MRHAQVVALHSQHPRPSRGRPRRAAAALLSAVALAAGCGGAAVPDAEDAGDGGPVHVHGLGLNPADGALYIASHTGLYRMEEGRDTAERVGDRRQDTMGFTVVGRDHFLGSGHPDPRADLPPHLGLIESTDGGRTWEPVSLLGEADLHVLRADGRRVLAYDVVSGLLLRSADGGRTWRGLRPPAALADAVAHPDDPGRLVAAGRDGLIGSRDGGRTWRQLDGAAVLLAWPRPAALYALEADGGVRMSADGGGSWSGVGRAPGSPAALTTSGAGRLVVALHEGGFANSVDGGRTWSPGAWP